jgi:RNA polymerase sigma factor (TIGR02999 family)
VGSEITQLLENLRMGDRSALPRLVQVLYDELHRIAKRQMSGERREHTLQATALVNEAYLKLVGNEESGFDSRAHFLAVASRVMRQVLVDQARSRATEKRRVGPEPSSAEWTASLVAEAPAPISPEELLDLDDALEALSKEDPSLEQLVVMRYFGGMTAEESAEALGLSVHVVRHDLRLAQAWLRRRLRSRS